MKPASGLFLGLMLAAVPLGAEEPLKKMADESRTIANQLLEQVRGELRREIDASGPLRGVIVCKYSVPEIASSVSRKYGMRVTRVSLRPRNPSLGFPDAWEQKVLADFDQRVAKGEKADGLEYAEIVSEPAGKFFRYVKAIPVLPICLTCHGPSESLSEAMKAQLGSEYPHDRATGYAVGQVRGAVTVKRPL